MPERSNSGLDIDLGDRCSRLAYDWARRSFANRAGRPGEVVDLDASFSTGLRFGEERLALTSDGIGTKIEVAERTGRYDTLGYDLVAMVADDLAANGVEPCSLSNILDVDRLDERAVDALMAGLHAAAAEAQVAVTGGEIAELGSRIGGWGGGMHFNWAATALGRVPAGRDPLDGSRLEPGDVLVALGEAGLRSNGFSLARRVLADKLGPVWHESMYQDRKWGEWLLTPSRIYCRAVVTALEAGIDLHAVSHITGGGIPHKLRRVLRRRSAGAVLDDLFEVPPFVAQLQRLGSVDARTAYTMWNMGNGMLLAVAPGAAERLLAHARAQGFEARRCGEVTADSAIVIVARGARPGRLVFPDGA